MWLILLSTVLLWSVTDHCQATLETCRDMGLYFCTECENTDLQCHSCQIGYTLKADRSGCLKCTDPNCLVCSLSPADPAVTDCNVCAAGYYLNDEDQTCVACGITNCDMCHLGNDSTIVCDTCAAGFYKVSDTECRACDVSCLNCTATTCLMCKYSGQAVSGADPTKCVACQTSAECTTCVTGDSTSPVKCAACVDGYYVSDDACVPCGVTSCKKCVDNLTCDVCLDYFYRASDNQCSECGLKCVSCTNSTACNQCADGFVAKSLQDVSCDACPANCMTCTPDQAADGQCTWCEAGYALDSVTKTCVACSTIPNCASCSSVIGSVTCVACEAGYLLSDNACYKCPANCKTCVFNSTAVPGYDTYCESCDTFYVINSELQCAPPEGCRFGVWNETVSAVQCECMTDNTPNPEADDDFKFWGFCSTDEYACQAGYYFTSATPVPSCEPCSPGCYYCNSSQCFACNGEEGYAPTPRNDGTCYKCTTGSPNCVSCSGDGQVFTCVQCMEGFYPDGAGCSACPDNCALCPDATSCTTCKVRTVQGSDGVCYACPDYCIQCEFVDGALVCSDGRCDVSFQKLASDGLCHPCPNNCKSCTESATTAGVLVCDTCLDFYAANTYTCAACPPNCAVCSISGPDTACVTCNAGFFVDSMKTCQNCASLTGVQNCASCTDDTSTTTIKCTACTTGYTIKDDGTECLSIASFGVECLDASDWPPTCSVCQDNIGVEFVQNKCLINCYACGTYVDMVPTSPADLCNSPDNVYSNIVQCEYGCATLVSYRDGEMVFSARGCIVNQTCLSDEVQQCTNIGPDKNCVSCCNSSELCNGYFYDVSAAPANHLLSIGDLLVVMVTSYIIY